MGDANPSWSSYRWESKTHTMPINTSYKGSTPLFGDSMMRRNFSSLDLNYWAHANHMKRNVTSSSYDYDDIPAGLNYSCIDGSAHWAVFSQNDITNPSSASETEMYSSVMQFNSEWWWPVSR